MSHARHSEVQVPLGSRRQAGDSCQPFPALSRPLHSRRKLLCVAHPALVINTLPILMRRRRELFQAGNGKRNPARVLALLSPSLGWAGLCPGVARAYLKPRSRTPALTFCAFQRSRRMARRPKRSTASYLNTSL